MRAASLVLFVALLLATSASAANAPTIGPVDATGYPTVRFSVVTPKPTSRAPVVREDGEPVVGFEAENLARAKSIAVVVDRSRSMSGKPIADAVDAARSFIASKSPADRVAVIAFGERAIRLTSFATSTIDADAALASLAIDARQGTALYDAIALGSRALAAEPLPGRVLIVLTDGDDVSSRTTLARAAVEARRAGAALYAIGIEGDGFSPRALEELARATTGAYFGAESSDAVAGAYASIADQLRRTWSVSYVTAATPGASVRIEARADGVIATTQTKLPGDASDSIVPSKEPSALVPGFLYENSLGIFVLALVSGSCVILAVGLAVATPSGTRLRRRLEPHTTVTRKRRGKISPRERFAAASGFMATTEKSLAHLRFWKFLHRQIERADLPLRTVELFYICVGSGVLLGLISAVAAAPAFVTLGLMAFGAAAPVLYATFRARRRIAAIDDQLPDVLITIAASLKAGHSFRQGLQAVVEEGLPPSASEFKRVLTETSLGRPMDDALNEMSERIASKNLDFVITAVTIQRQVGGSLAGIFDMVADSVRNRQQFIRKVKGLTAMGRAAAYVLIGLPFFLAATFTLVNPTYMAPLWETSAGHKIVIGGLVMMAFGSLILRKMVTFRG